MEYAENKRKAYTKIKNIVPIASVSQFHRPLYSSGHWLFGFASKQLHPIQDMQADTWNQFGLKTRYYNTDLHVGAFMLAKLVKEKLGRDELFASISKFIGRGNH